MLIHKFLMQNIRGSLKTDFLFIMERIKAIYQDGSDSPEIY